MINIILQEQRTTDIELGVHIKGDINLEIEAPLTWRVEFTENNDKCIAYLEQRAVCNSSPEIFNIKVCITGVFACSGIESEDDKKVVHVMAYHQIFPYIQSTFSYLTGITGLPPLMLPQVDTKPEDVIFQK